MEYFTKQGIAPKTARQLYGKFDNNGDSAITFKEFFDNIFLTSKVAVDDSFDEEHEEVYNTRVSSVPSQLKKSRMSENNRGRAELWEEPDTVADAKVSWPVEVQSLSLGRSAGISSSGKSP